MSEKLIAPSVGRMIDDLRRRLSILERRTTTSTAAGSVPNDDIIFSYAGALTSGTESPPVKVRHAGPLGILAVALGTAGSTSTTLEVKRNSTVVATVVVPSSVSDYGAAVGASFAGEDRLSINVSAAGTGAANMTASARFT